MRSPQLSTISIDYSLGGKIAEALQEVRNTLPPLLIQVTVVPPQF